MVVTIVPQFYSTVVRLTPPMPLSTSSDHSPEKQETEVALSELTGVTIVGDLDVFVTNAKGT
jgi:hypothetical protein